jgi:nitrate reductase alpha subunit
MRQGMVRAGAGADPARAAVRSPCRRPRRHHEEDRGWEEAYRKRWQHDKIVRSTHGVNCTGLLLLEDLRQGRDRHLGDAADRLSAHAARPAQPRAARLLARRQLQLVSLFRQPGEVSADRGGCCGCGARRARHWIRSRPGRRSSRMRSARSYTSKRGQGGFVRVTGTRSTRSSPPPTPIRSRSWGPDRVFGFSPIPAMSMVSYAAGSRYLSLLGGVCMSSTTGIATCRRPRRRPGASRPTCRKVPTGTIPASSCCGARTCRRRARRTRISTPRRATAAPRASSSARLFGGVEVRRHLAVGEAGHGRGAGMAMGHVILKEFHVDRQVPYFATTAANTPTCRCWCGWCKKRRRYVPDRFVRAPTSPTRWARPTIPTGRRSPSTNDGRIVVVPRGSIGFRWGEKGKWNLEEKERGGRRSSCGCRCSTSAMRWC